MIRLDYLQFYYKGVYTKEFIEIPDDSLVFKISNLNISYKFNDTWSYNILILSKKSIENLNSVCLGEWYLAMIDSVYSEYNFNDINQFPKIDFYIVKYNFRKIDISLPIERIEKESIYGIYKFKGIDSNYIYFSYVAIKNPITMDNIYLLEYTKDDIRNTILSNYETKILYGDKIKNLYEEFYTKVINKIK